jgi:hypothetical protein
MAEFILGPCRFPTKKAAIQAVRDILHTSKICAPLTGLEAELIAALAGQHHDAANKIGPGITRIDVRTMDSGSRSFWITRADGSLENFSYRKCFEGQRTPRATALAAMRKAIEPQILSFRREEFYRARSAGERLVCPLTGNALAEDQSTHVDHHGEEFAALAERFAQPYGGLEQIPTRTADDYGDEISDDSIFDAWDAFHRSYAQLRLLHRSANLARLVRS